MLGDLKVVIEHTLSSSEVNQAVLYAIEHCGWMIEGIETKADLIEVCKDWILDGRDEPHTNWNDPLIGKVEDLVQSIMAKKRVKRSMKRKRV